MEGPKAILLTRIHKCNQVENLPAACEEGVRLSQRLKDGSAQCLAVRTKRQVWNPDPAEVSSKIPIDFLRARMFKPAQTIRKPSFQGHTFAWDSQGPFEFWLKCLDYFYNSSYGFFVCRELSNTKNRAREQWRYYHAWFVLKKNSFSFHEVIDPISVFIITLPCEKVVLNFNKGRELHISTRAQMLPAIQEVESSFANSYRRPDLEREREIICPHRVNKPCLGHT